MQIIGKQLCKVQSATQSLCEHFLTCAQPSTLVMSLLPNPHWKMGESLLSKLHKIRQDFLLLHRIERDCIYLQIIAQQGKCETVCRVAQGTVMLALDFIYDYLGLHCNAHCCSRQLGSVRPCAGWRVVVRAAEELDM